MLWRTSGTLRGESTRRSLPTRALQPPWSPRPAEQAVVPTTVDADGVVRYPPEVEAAVYFCCLEALQNVAKYAGASGAFIRLVDDDGHLRFEVEDDGNGFDPTSTHYGTGLQGMADRLEAIGGTIEIRSAPAEGTTVAGHVPARGATP